MVSYWRLSDHPNTCLVGLVIITDFVGSACKGFWVTPYSRYFPGKMWFLSSSSFWLPRIRLLKQCCQIAAILVLLAPKASLAPLRKLLSESSIRPNTLNSATYQKFGKHACKRVALFLGLFFPRLVLFRPRYLLQEPESVWVSYEDCLQFGF